MPVLTLTDALLALCMFLAAALYSSVGHAGASAYLALMSLFGVSALVMRPTALVLNILVSSLTVVRFWRAGLVRLRTVWPFLAGALPMAFLGGSIQLGSHIYRPLVGAVLLVSAVRLLWPKDLRSNTDWSDPPVLLAVPAGAAIGLLSGLTGTGGGLFLSPLILFLAWSETRAASGAAAVFILCVSAAGLAGNIASVQALPPALPLYGAAVILGAVVGTHFGISRFAPQAILKALGVVLIIAAAKLIGLY